MAWAGNEENPFADQSSGYKPPDLSRPPASSINDDNQGPQSSSLLDLSESPSWASSSDYQEHDEQQALFDMKVSAAESTQQAAAVQKQEVQSVISGASIPNVGGGNTTAAFDNNSWANQQPPLDPIMTQSTQGGSSSLPTQIIYMRLMNIALSAVMFLSSLLSLTGDDFSTAVLSIYVMAFSCLLCCFETHLKAVSIAITENFGFLYNAKGRATFLVFVGLLCFSQGFLGTIAGVGMILNAAFSFYVICTHEEYEAIHAAYGQEDGATVLKRQGGQLLVNNPQLAQRGADATLNWAGENPGQASGLFAAGASAAGSNNKSNGAGTGAGAGSIQHQQEQPKLAFV